jgi:hypothetical protein
MADGVKLAVIYNSVLLKFCADLVFIVTNKFVVKFTISYLFLVYLTTLTIAYII